MPKSSLDVLFRNKTFYFVLLASFVCLNAYIYHDQSRDKKGYVIIHYQKKPRILIPPHNISVLANSQAIFICLSEGNPKPNIKWLFNNNDQLPDRYTLIKDYVLRLTSTMSADNGARITCRAINVMGSDERSSTIKVYNDINVVPKGFPKYLGKSSIIVGQKYSNVSIECNVIGNPLPNIIWLKNYYPLDIRNSRFKLQNERNLLLLKTVEQDNAKYYCMASNVHGVVISPAMSLMIRVSQFSPHFIYVTPDQYVRPGSSVTLKCTGEGSPTPIVYWICGNTKLTSSSLDPETNFLESVGTIKTILSDISESLNCTCVAKNARESANHTVHIIIKNFPLAPQIVRVSSISDNTCLLTWKYQTIQNVVVSSFSVFYIASKLLRKEQPLYQTIDISAKEIRGSDFEINTKITGLLPFMNYSLWLVANGAEGVSEPSNINTFMTLESKPSSPPQNISILLVSETSIRLNWKAPIHRNGKITSYEILFSKNKDIPLNQWNLFSVPIVQDHEFVTYSQNIGFLEKNTMYYFRINSKNKIGFGPFSKVIQKFVNEDEIYQLKNLTVVHISKDSISMLWTTNLLSSLQYFKLQYTPVPNTFNEENEGNYQIIKNNPNKQSFYFAIISNLLPNTAYFIIIFPAVNGVLKTATKTKAKTMAANVHERFHAIATSSNSILISFLQRTTEESIILEVEYFPFDKRSKNQKVKCRLDSDSGGYSLMNLESHTLYKLILKYNKTFSMKYVETWTDAPQKVQDLELKLACEPLKPCIFASWKYNNTSDTLINIRYYPIDLQEQAEISKFTYVFNVTKMNFISHPNTHVMGSTVEFVVRGVTEFQMSKAVYAKITLPEGVPSDYPRNLQVHSNMLEKFVSITWDMPNYETINGQLRQNEIVCKGNKDLENSFHKNISNNEIQIPKTFLTKETHCQVRYWTKVGPGPWSQLMPIDYIHTDVDPPSNIIAIRISEHSIKVTWKWNPEFINSYSRFSIKTTVASKNDTGFITDTMYPSSVAYVDNLQTENVYSIQVKSILKNGRQSPWSYIVTPTLFSELWQTQSVHYPKCVISTFRSVNLQWIFPYKLDQLSHFRINFTGVTKYTSTQGKPITINLEEKENSLTFIQDSQEYVKQIDNLKPNTEYSFDIEPILSVATSVWTVSIRTICQTSPEAPVAIPEPKIAKVDRDNLIIYLNLEHPSNEYGSINLYYLIVAPNNFISQNSKSSDISKSKMSPVTHDQVEASLLSIDNNLELSNEQSQYITVEINATLLMRPFRPGQVFTFPLGCTETDIKFTKNRPLKRGQDYRALFVACVTSHFKKETIRKLCSMSSWSEVINSQHSRPFPMQNFDIIRNKHINETSQDHSILIGVVLTAVLVPLLLCCVIIFIRFIIKRRSESGKIFNPCVKLRSTSQDYYPTSGNEMKENLVNPLMASANIGSSYSAQNPDSIEFKRYHISSTPDLLVQSSPSTSYKYKEKAYGHSYNFSLSQHRVPITLLHEYISNLKANENRGFSIEFESIDHANQFSWEHSNKICNKIKNRYANVVAYDHSRVVLQTISSTDSNASLNTDSTDYINANYINGYRKQNAYIATQGPLPETIGDFWRMIWEQRTVIVVMLTLLVERSRVKCEQYWPKGTKGAQCTFGGIMITLTFVQELTYFISRSFMIQKIGSPEKRELKHFQFTAWPDHGVPQCTIPFLMFVNKIKKEVSLDSGPIIIHCSAGVGRTGDFIVVDSMLEQIKHEKYIDIYSYVTHIRCQRNYMVQTEEQYIFIHDVLLDYLQSVNTDITSQQLFSHVERLSKIEIEKSCFLQVSGFQLEYRRLLRWSSMFSHIIPSTKSECSTKSSDSITGQQELYTVNYETALSNINQSKNKSPLCLPPDINRVVLCPIRALEGSDYINASWIDGYRFRKTYIATQCPLKETIEDFWRMLWEQECGIVITLNDMQESSQYWPFNRSARYQFFVVDPVAEYQMSHFVLREFKLTDARDGQTRVLRQFQFIDWIEDSPIPISTENFIELIVQVQKTREQFGHNGPITVHCGTGSSKTGIFLALSILIEKLKEENSLNIFEIFKLLKWQRPSLVDSEDQYQFCFAALLEYLTLYSDECSQC